MKYGNLNLDTNLDIRVIRNDEFDIDLFIDLKYRTVDLNVKNCIIKDRIQFISVRALLIRLNKNNYISTIHIMKDIDINSAICNFEIDYEKRILFIDEIENKIQINFR
ncbi:MAG: hypothetical protein R3Y64_00435 [Peptostreptococcaceae bacterium]